MSDTKLASLNLNQTGSISHYIFPIFTAKQSKAVLEHDRNVGTGFIVNTSGLALTASHCIQGDNDFYAMFPQNNYFMAVRLKIVETHPKEDVALVQLQLSEKCESACRLSNEDVRGSLDYFSFGYPVCAYRLSPEHKPTPDLIYTAGYVRRNYPFSLTNIKGNDFIELSVVGGAGYSGSPIFNVCAKGQKLWGVIGIYLGEASISVGENDKQSFGYAVKTRSFIDWFKEAFR